MPVEPPRPGNEKPGQESHERELLNARRWRTKHFSRISCQQKQNERPKAIVADPVLRPRLPEIKKDSQRQQRQLNRDCHCSIIPQSEAIQTTTRIKRQIGTEPNEIEQPMSDNAEPEANGAEGGTRKAEIQRSECRRPSHDCDETVRIRINRK